MHSSSNASWNLIMKRLEWFDKNYHWKINNGGNIFFLFANWSNSDPLHKAFSRLFTLAINKEATIMDRQNDRNKIWTLDHRRPLNDIEKIILDSIHFSLNIPDQAMGEGKPKWNLNKDNSFSIASIKHTLVVDRVSIHQFDGTRQLFSSIWKSTLPKNIKFFLWSLFHKKINKVDVLQKKLRNHCLNPSVCIHCMEKGEDLDHLLPFSELQNHFPPFAQNLPSDLRGCQQK